MTSTSEISSVAARRAGHRIGAARSGAGIHHHPRRRDRRRGLRRRRHQAGHREGLHPRTAHLRRPRARSPPPAAIHLEGYAPEIDVPKGAQLIDGPVEARKAAREQLDQRRRLDQGLHDPPLLGRQAGQPRLAADAHGRGAARHRRRGARLEAERWPATPTTAWGCAAPSTAAATRSSTASSSTTPNRADGEAGNLVRARR